MELMVENLTPCLFECTMLLPPAPTLMLILPFSNDVCIVSEHRR